MATANDRPPLDQRHQPDERNHHHHHHHQHQHPNRDFAAWRARLAARLASLPAESAPIVLVACGSFNPPTRAHLRLFSSGAAAVDGRASAAGAAPKLAVVGGLLSPVGDGYGKAGLAPAAHRLAMCALAASEAAAPGAPVDVCVHGWEATRGDGGEAAPAHTRTLDVLRHIERELNSLAAVEDDGGEEGGGGGRRGGAAGTMATATTTPTATTAAAAAAAGTSPHVRVMLLAGTDLVESMRRPGVWSEPDVLLREHGVVCVERPPGHAGVAVALAAAPAAPAVTAPAAAESAVDEALLESRVLHAECDEEVMAGVSSSRAREALRAALADADADAAAAEQATEKAAAARAAAAAAAADPRVSELLDPRVAEYAALHALY